jgi:hypothetical protein
MLVKLRTVDKLTFKQIANELARTSGIVRDYKPVHARYQLLADPAHKDSTRINWTPKLDNQVITLSHAGKSVPEIAKTIRLSHPKVKQRHRTLREQGRVPISEITAIRKLRSEATVKVNEWTLEEDEVLARMWIAGVDMNEIHKTAKLAKFKTEIVQRKRDLSSHPELSLMYRKLLMEYNVPGQDWTSEDIINRKFEVGSWKRMPEPPGAPGSVKDSVRV